MPIIHTDTSGPVKANLLSTHPVCKQDDYRAVISPGGGHLQALRGIRDDQYH
ncbi:hypothetical protein KJZ00_01005 [Cutibacterium avidum]|uniref:hypothetical protein n=1 Tax=Cutibacterium avidum TaxID=33010 RepID=UPI00137474B4|nr:hypothetical protein [Cutibacterium avidum]MCO6630935.1 hypothetical protein [Cutibacterium avidum]MCO6659363.1 hypothetical protein [Cutibacterium avidum]MCO6663795.1 hypothetical protein [Cutibacterium avidum]MCT1416649.1 hypothetical protein [Cutibacterium avidum]MDQ9080785.1 hypothetical protein [Cutibacterium avidum]